MAITSASAVHGWWKELVTVGHGYGGCGDGGGGW